MNSSFISCTIFNPKVCNKQENAFLSQNLVLELEFNEFARGKWEITELEFAEMLMRYTDSYDMEEQMKAIASRLKNEKGSIFKLENCKTKRKIKESPLTNSKHFSSS